MFRQTLYHLLIVGLLCSNGGYVAAAPQEIAELQEAMVQIENSPMSDEQKQQAREQIQKQMMSKQGGGENKPGEKKPDDKKKEDDKKKDDEKKEEEPKTVKRPEKPKKPVDPQELEATPTNGKLILNFHGHPWPAMVDWYSRVTGREIEWQELPTGYVNLRTQEPMTLDETGDLLNRLLLGRGFTMLDDGNFLQVVKTEGINPAFVPRVRPQQLLTMAPHGFVRTSFQLQRFKADEIVKELETMKSQHGQLSAMTAANRIEAMDIVSNLRDIYVALDQEQSSGVHAPQEFIINYLRADVVKEKIGEMFGMEKKQQAPTTPQQMQEMMQRRQMEQQQNQGQPPAAKKEAPKINMIVNELKNSIIVKAPPHIMLDITDAIRLLDVKPSRDSLDIKAYPLATRTPAEVAEMLNESGALSPTAIIRVDKDTKTLLLSGTPFDHFRVSDLIERIDGNARRFVSIRLRRYPAVQVATTIEKMMGVEEKDDSRSRRRYYWWDDNQEEDDKSDKFAVTADVENNRLILKCNDAEYEMVMDLLTQMGEVLSRSKFEMNEVVLDDISQEDEDAILRRVQEAFKAYAPNEVILPPPREAKKEEEKPEKEPEDDGSDAFRTRTTMQQRKPSNRTLLTQVLVDPAQDQSSVKKTAASAPAPPPIYIERNSQGKIVLRSKDAAALEMFEELMRSMAPRGQDWVSFKLKHVTAYWMRLQLEDFFDEEEENRSPFFFWGWDEQEEDKPPGLGDEPTMRFIDDGESTLVVRNASPKQMVTVKQLIDLYDVSEPPSENNARYKKMIHIKFSRARTIETVLKDTFRDLLSSNDKAFEQQNKGDGEGDRGSRRFFNPFFDTEEDEGDLAGSTFKGKLSFGVDESTNILIITAQGKNLLDIVVDMVEELDRAAVPTDETRVVAVPPSLNSIRLQETLVRMFGPEAVGGKSEDDEKGGEEGEEPAGDERRREFEAAMRGRGG